MNRLYNNNGSVLLVVVFAAAMLSAITIGILHLTSEELQLMNNHIGSVGALAAAEAGLNDSFARIREGSDPNIAGESYSGGSYTAAAVQNSNFSYMITSTGISSLGFIAKVEADITTGNTSPYVIRIDNLRINE